MRKPNEDYSYSQNDEYSYDSLESEAISVRCPFFIKEHVDVQDKDGNWRNGEIIKVFFSN